jgi:hypothetical protein
MVLPPAVAKHCCRGAAPTSLLSIKVISMGMTLLSSMARLALP